MVRPFPVGPLESAIAAGRCSFTARDVANVLGVSFYTVRGWRSRGLSIWQADELAVAAGFHPWEIWPEWVDVLLAEDGLTEESAA